MKKLIEKIVKKTKKVIHPDAPLSSTVTCPACLGSGLWRPEYTNSPQCEKCIGHGVITV